MAWLPPSRRAGTGRIKTAQHSMTIKEVVWMRTNVVLFLRTIWSLFFFFMSIAVFYKYIVMLVCSGSIILSFNPRRGVILRATCPFL